MQIDKETVLGLLRKKGKDDEAEQASRELPDTVDTERDSGLLQRSEWSRRSCSACLPAGAKSRGCRSLSRLKEGLRRPLSAFT